MPANKSSVSKRVSEQKMGEFWDKRDFAEFDDPNALDIPFHITAAVAIEPDLLADIETLAHLRGIKVETLVNLWLKEKVVQARAG